MKFVSMMFLLLSFNALAESPAGVNKLKKVLVDSTMKDCDFLAKHVSTKFQQQAEKNPEFFKKNVMQTTCVAHLIRPKEACMTNSFNKIMDKGEGKGLSKDQAEALAKGEQANTKRCLEAAIRDVKVKLEDAAVDPQKAQVLMKAAETTIKGF